MASEEGDWDDTDQWDEEEDDAEDEDGPACIWCGKPVITPLGNVLHANGWMPCVRPDVLALGQRATLAQITSRRRATLPYVIREGP